METVRIKNSHTILKRTKVKDLYLRNVKTYFVATVIKIELGLGERIDKQSIGTEQRVQKQIHAYIDPT